MHAEYGGVVPELASRDHIRRVPSLVTELLADCGRGLDDLGAVAYTQGPGLAGALLVGAAFAGGLSFALDLPCVGVHHLEGHLLSPMLGERAPDFPFLALLVSGGHTQLLEAGAPGRYRLLGDTLDDAAGEAFDKTAQLLGLGYPGGPAISALALRGNPARFTLPRPMLHSPGLDLSFSGLKTAVALLVKRESMDDQARADLAAGVELAIAEVLTAKAVAALRATGLPRLVVAGGVGANRRLREHLSAAAEKLGVPVFYPDLALCTDNGAMIAFAGALRLAEATRGAFQVRPRWDLASLSEAVDYFGAA